MSALIKSFKNERILDHLFSDRFFDDYLPKTTNVPFDVVETDDEYKIDLLLAGFEKEDFSLEVEDGKLIISGERKESEDTKYNVKQSYFGIIKKTFTLPKDVVVDKIDAEYVNGVLKVKVPKDRELIRSKLIEVR